MPPKGSSPPLTSGAALPKPHRVAFLVPDIKIEGTDGAYEREAAVLLWVACIETCQRHPRLSVLDADATRCGFGSAAPDVSGGELPFGGI